MPVSQTLRRIVVWGVLSALTVAVSLSIATAVLLRSERVKTTLAGRLSEHLNLEVDIAAASFSFLPRPRLNGSGLTLRIPSRPDLPPFISIDSFSMDVGLLSALRKQVDTVHVDGLRIAVPPGDARDQLPGRDGAESNPSSSEDDPGIIVRRLVTHDATLLFVPRNPEKTPLTFAIHDLTVDNLGFGHTMPFTARLTNPIPKGLIQASGAIGPWTRDDVSRLPVAGTYTFSDADLSTINGIGGILNAKGQFGGHLTAIQTNGEAQIPDFSLDLGGKPVPLSATFDTVVNGTDGSTYLQRVNAKILNTEMTVNGAVENLPGPGNRQVRLHVHIPDGRIEDLLTMVLDAAEPIMTGDVTVRTSLVLPPGPRRVRDRLELSGEFGLAKTEFTSDQVQAKLETLSRRSQGKKKEDPIGRVLTNLRGSFELRDGRARFRRLTFAVPGATVAMNGSYNLASTALNFQGSLRMKATVSQAVGGFRSIFIRPFDRLFRKDGAGAVVPISITGTREQPKFGLDMGRIF